MLPKSPRGFKIRRMLTMTGMFRRLFNRGEVDCQDVRKAGSDYLDDDLPPQRRSAVQVHLDKCGPCRAFIDSLSSTIGLLTRMPKATPPPSFKQSIIERTKQSEKER